ncbi:hypothetical protein BG006_001825 [Podila minutissima]|uniref:Oligopeptide transporter n=1 Tax=Podila minutissima TaxID=64525 RepID=A0A9P5SDD9_9FUNG|nr:hypothetical protein BG006_001825 [Podila minutissima]
MRVYPEVPNWWYGLLFVVTLALSMVTCVFWDFMPWWAVLLALAIAIFFVLPVGIVQAATNQQPGFNIITEFVIGYMLPGHAIANVTFKVYGYIVNIQALNFVLDLRLGQFIKIPPRIMFMAQVISTVISGIINLSTATWLINTRPPHLHPEGLPLHLQQYQYLLLGLDHLRRDRACTTGPCTRPSNGVRGRRDPAPVFWLLAKKFPNVGWLKLVHWPVLLAATSNMPPYMPYMYTNGLFVGFIFMFLLPRYKYGWWSRYNYLTSAALDSGLAICGLVIFYALQNQEILVGQPGSGRPHPGARPLRVRYFELLGDSLKQAEFLSLYFIIMK